MSIKTFFIIIVIVIALGSFQVNSLRDDSFYPNLPMCLHLYYHLTATAIEVERRRRFEITALSAHELQIAFRT